eukprot:symbB.v1.2.008430.t1/scaffold522.1/size192531/3
MWPTAKQVLNNKGHVVSLKWIKAVLEDALDPNDLKLLRNYVPDALLQKMTHGESNVSTVSRDDTRSRQTPRMLPVQRIQHVQRIKAPDPRDFSRSLQQTQEEADLRQALQNSLDDLAMVGPTKTESFTHFA